MNTVIKILFFTLIILLLACKKEPVYNEIPENQKQALLYYKYNEGDTILLLSNNIDTLVFHVEKRIVEFRKRYYGSSNQSFYEYYTLNIKGINNENYIYINAYNNSNSYPFEFIFCSQMFSIGGYDFINFNNQYNINNQIYYNIYSISNNNNNDSIFTSPEKGIIKIKNDTISFSLIE